MAANSDFWVLAGILATVGSLGVYEGSELHPAFYSQSSILFGGLGYFAYKALYLDRKVELTQPGDLDKSRSSDNSKKPEG
jgi:hypothetical protein